ncbi:MAG: hypothetical protein ABR518_10205 [Actinomycetota bacterium]
MPEIILATVLSLLGVRSLLYWWRRHYHAENLREQLLYVAYVTARVGMWFGLAAFFVGYRIVDYDPQGLGWYLLVLIGLASVQLLASFFLSGRARGTSRGEPPGSEG